MTRTGLNMCFNQAVNDKLLLNNPITGTNLPPREQRQSKIYKPDMVKSFLEQGNAGISLTAAGTPDEHNLQKRPYWDALLTIYNTGLRRAECCNLKWSDWDIENKHCLLVRGTKSEKSNRIIAISSTIITIFERRKAEAHGEYIFEQYGSEKPILDTNLYRFSRTRFGKSIQSLRHTWTSNAIKAGINPQIVQEQLGHTSVKTTLDIYTEISMEQKIDALEKMIEKLDESE